VQPENTISSRHCHSTKENNLIALRIRYKKKSGVFIPVSVIIVYIFQYFDFICILFIFQFSLFSILLSSTIANNALSRKKQELSTRNMNGWMAKQGDEKSGAFSANSKKEIGPPSDSA
jgi:hypothetical protein